MKRLSKLCLLAAPAALCGACTAAGVSTAASMNLPATLLAIVGVLVAVLAGLGAILGGLSMILHAIAPRTATPFDDRWAADVDALHSKVDEVRDVVSNLASKLLPVESVPVASAPAPSSSSVAKAGAVTMLALTLGLSAAAMLPACTGTQLRQDLSAGVVAALDCEASHVDATTLGDAKSLADAEVQRWIGGTAPTDLATLQAKIKADLTPIKTDLGHCAVTGALAGALAAAGVGTASSSGTATAVQGLLAMPSDPSGPDAATVRAAFAGAVRELGWAPVKVASGEVY